jgi:hypothetical protein
MSIDVPFAARENDVTFDANRQFVSQSSSVLESNLAQCCMVTTLEDSSGVNRDSLVLDSDSNYDHMKCIFDPLPEMLSR